MDVAEGLALVNALLTIATLGFLAAGYRAIRRREILRHRNRMIAAFICSAAFMVLFVFRFAKFGFRPFEGEGVARGVYYVVMFAHEPIAVLSVPMGIVTLGLGLARAKSHKEIARPTAVIWSISAVTGVLFYVLLYWIQ